jgi:hypothetical protein
VLWVVACGFDRADGELAGVGILHSESSKIFNYYADMTFDISWFVDAATHLRHGWPGPTITVFLSVLCGVSMLVISWCAQLYERLSAPGVSAWPGVRRFHIPACMEGGGGTAL